MREKKGVVTGELPPSHHHDGHHLWCFCFLWGSLCLWFDPIDLFGRSSPLICVSSSFTLYASLRRERGGDRRVTTGCVQPFWRQPVST
ncbi:hypothetical protein HanHA300_Chr14g0524421 [Helianthus annuus]|nr:hypothetical protein HanHA300_Chr14g0524421 [Helianthus annuus]KAJ0485778.1 hypothetical protein HanHA89_Chr14g0572151 [Helianthus annuus]KAJ0656330.1 hypothetical protein HanLR1_Chr14g0534541 [Helianthus annuus]